MKFRIFFMFVLTTAGFSCSVEEAPELDHLMIYEKPDEHTEIKLSWKVNGQADEGSVADIMLYISESVDMSEAQLSESLGKVSVSYFDFLGNQRIVPSRKSDMFNAYRYYVGIAYHGLNNPAGVSFPLEIDYKIEIANEATGAVITTIEDTFVIESSDRELTNIKYTYTLDFFENEPETSHQNYSLRELAEPIIVQRESDVERTNTFVASKNLYAELQWKVNGETSGFEKIDMDLVLHNTANTNIDDLGDLDAVSAVDNSYEGFTIFPDNTYFTPPAPERIGFYFYENYSTEPAAVEYTFILYQFDGNIKRHVISGSFETPPVEPNVGTFYFVANIRKIDDTYVVEPLATPMQWTP
jgi:hypothetical protein